MMVDMPVQEWVLDEIRRMSVADLMDLVRALESEVEGRDRSEPSAVVERSGSDFSLWDFGADKIEIIKAVREITDLGLREAQVLVGASPSEVAAGGHDADADEPGTAGVPAKPKGAPPAGEAGEKLPIPRCPRRVA